MLGKDLDRLQRLLRVASRLPAGERVSFLAQAEPTRAELRDEVCSLLSHDGDRGELCAPHLSEPTEIGPYHLHDRLGEASPARLYRAWHVDRPSDPLLVAVAGPGPAAQQVALALEGQVVRQRDLADPIMARILDAGSTASSHLYAAFEGIEGVPLAEFCDVLTLSLVDRVALIEQVALAVERAHQAGVAPLGLMPWSVLGSWHIGAPVVRLIAVDPWPLLALLEPERRAEADLLAGLETSAPEALRGEARGVQTDVFALGALLFESVTGTAPLGLRRLAGHRGLRDELRMAARIVAPLASERVERLGRRTEEIARRRATKLEPLLRDLRSGLDGLLARALSPDPTQRPPCAAAFAGELAAWRTSGRGGVLNSARDFGRRLVAGIGAVVPRIHGAGREAPPGPE